MDQPSEVPTLIRTLVGAGFTVTNTATKPHYLVANAKRFDEFGIATNYVFVYCTSGTLSAADCSTLRTLARDSQSALVIAGQAAQIPEAGVLISKDDLIGKLGGPVLSLLPLEPDYVEQLVALSKNKLPPGVVGRPDDLFERYVHAGLQFLLRGRVLRYGQERRFEALPDGLVINGAALLMLYDCKATDSVYEITKEAIRQFADYVRDFSGRYGRYLELPHAFVVVSSAFQDNAVLQSRANELYGECHVPLLSMTAETLGECVKLFVDHPLHRIAINWKHVFVPPRVEVSNVKKQMDARIKDGVIR